MRYFAIFIFFVFTSCQYLPDLSKNVESIETDKAIRVEVSREAFQKETNLDIAINVQNKDEPIAPASAGSK